MSFTSDEVNYLIYRYLSESGKDNKNTKSKNKLNSTFIFHPVFFLLDRRVQVFSATITPLFLFFALVVMIIRIRQLEKWTEMKNK